ncbi:Oligosaccharide translocation protein rft1 [Kappamyces sp. JEL0680]|nr:Oligosaccharide translocation protein rft1 [Kappamyces sp. JEL0680]
MDPYLTRIAFSFGLHTVIKHVLTVADKIVLVALGIANQDKGAYKLVSDLGSLVARIVFLPIEETSRAYFSKSLTNLKEQAVEKHVHETYLVLRTLCQIHIILGACFVFFATHYTDILLAILYGKANAQVASLLSWYCFYVPFLGLNGITEAFVQGVADASVLSTQAVFMVAFWGLYIVTSYVTMVSNDMKAFGLVASNIINMALRIVFSTVFIQAFFTKRRLSRKKKEFRIDFSLRSFVPGNRYLWLLFVLSALAIWYAGPYLHPVLRLGLGLVLFFATMACLWLVERRRLFEDAINLFNTI